MFCYYNKRNKEIGIPVECEEDINYAAELLSLYGIPYKLTVECGMLIFNCKKSLETFFNFRFVTRDMDTYFRRKHEKWVLEHKATV